MDEFGMGSPTEAFVLSGLSCDEEILTGSFIRRISSSCCRNIMYSFGLMAYASSLVALALRLLMLGCFFMLSPGMRGLNPRVANSLKGVKVGPSARRLKMVLILE
ncbi:unnamed protein product [Brassica napus]|uniref:(rape) hypothetical protein n=1 Tax=Brassica napus TaxID=3708 RepID=A0A817A6H1_BRANA|nr:unnamed protein product [Brassica napus]